MSVPRKRTYLAAGDRRAQILDIAKRVFARRGYQRANIAHICTAAKIGRGTLYQYFDNKQAVLTAILEQVIARMQQVIDQRPTIESLRVRPERLTAADVATFCGNRMRDVLLAVFVDEATLRIVLRDARGHHGAIERAVSQIDALVLGAIEADLESAMRLGVLRRGDARMHARYSLGGLEKVVLTALANDEPIDLDRLVRDTVHVQLFGLLAAEVRR